MSVTTKGLAVASAVILAVAGASFAISYALVSAFIQQTEVEW